METNKGRKADKPTGDNEKGFDLKFWGGLLAVPLVGVLVILLAGWLGLKTGLIVRLPPARERVNGHQH